MCTTAGLYLFLQVFTCFNKEKCLYSLERWAQPCAVCQIILLYCWNRSHICISPQIDHKQCYLSPITRRNTILNAVKARYTFYIFIIALLANIAFNIVLIPRFGIEGAAFSSSLCYSIGSLTLAFWYSIKYNISFLSLLFININDIKYFLLPHLKKLLLFQNKS